MNHVSFDFRREYILPGGNYPYSLMQDGSPLNVLQIYRQCITEDWYDSDLLMLHLAHLAKICLEYQVAYREYNLEP